MSDLNKITRAYGGPENSIVGRAGREAERYPCNRRAAEDGRKGFVYDAVAYLASEHDCHVSAYILRNISPLVLPCERIDRQGKRVYRLADLDSAARSIKNSREWRYGAVDGLVSIAETAERLQLRHIHTVYQHVASGRLKADKSRRPMMILADSISAFERTRMANRTPAITANRRRDVYSGHAAARELGLSKTMMRTLIFEGRIPARVKRVGQRNRIEVEGVTIREILASDKRCACGCGARVRPWAMTASVTT